MSHFNVHTFTQQKNSVLCFTNTTSHNNIMSKYPIIMPSLHLKQFCESFRQCAERHIKTKHGNLRQRNYVTFFAQHITKKCTHETVKFPDIFQRSYFTNTDEMKKSDPYAALGLSWGATATEIKEAYRSMARQLHPDVSDLDPTEALNKFRIVKEAYDKLMNNKKAGTHRTDLWEEWSFAAWRSADLIAQDRTDVAGVSRKRPMKPAESLKRRWGVAALGHPDGRGSSFSGRDYLSSGEEKRRSSTVGTGQSKWVTKKGYQEWNPDNSKLKGTHNMLRNKTRRDGGRNPDEDL